MLRLTYTSLFKGIDLSKYFQTIIKSNKRRVCEVSLLNIVKSSSQFSTITSKSQYDSKESEEKFLVRIKNDPDVFGQSVETPQEVDESDLREEEFLKHPVDASQKLRTKQYADIIKSLIRQRKIKEAIDVLEIKMLKDDRVKPESYIYNLLLGACGRVGYTKKAFSLYNKMKQRGLKPMGGTFTALFNACSNSPWPEDGLSRAKHLREKMIEAGYKPNVTTYNAMIKAFGRCGDISMAFSLVDEMDAAGIIIKQETLNFLIQSCISDKEVGFRHCLLVWRKFIDCNITPDIHSYNLLLKCVRECGMGDTETTRDVINKILPENKKLLECVHSDPSSDVQKNSVEINSLEISKQDTEVVEVNNILTEVSSQFQENRPNLLSKTPHLGTILSLSEVLKPEDRLLLLGGFTGFLKNMVENKCDPDIKTFTQLLECIPNASSTENELLLLIRKFNIKPDIDFYNMLIKKRSMCSNFEGAKEVVDMLRQLGYSFNLMTYGVLAIGCTTKEQGEGLIEEMKMHKYRLNIEILGSMLYQACRRMEFSYVLYLMETCINEEIRPNELFIKCLETFKKKCRENLSKTDNKTMKFKTYEKKYMVFKLRYQSFLNQVDPIKDDEVHPWQQFRQTSNTDVKHFKEKDGARFKPIHTSLYRNKTSAKLVRQSNSKWLNTPRKRNKQNY